MESQTDREKGLKKLLELIKDIDLCMLTTVDAHGDLHSRPMSNNGEVDADGDLWFFTSMTSLKVEEIERLPKVNVSFSDPRTQRYVSVSGKGKLVRDRAKMEKLWKPQFKAWFPKGLEDPELGLLKVDATAAEYWDAHSSFVAHAIGLVKALVTGEPAKDGEHQAFSLGR